MISYRVVERTQDGDLIWSTGAMPQNRAESIRRKMISAEQYEVELGHELHIEVATPHNNINEAAL